VGSFTLFAFHFLLLTFYFLLFTLNEANMPENISINDLILSAGAMRHRLDFLSDEDPFRVVIEARAEIVTDPADFNLTTAEIGKEQFDDEDYLIIKSVFVTSQPFRNENRDAFRREDLAAVAGSGQISNTKPGILDLNHDFFPYGVVLDKKAVAASVEMDGEIVEVTQLEVYSVLWAWRFPELAASVRKWYKEGNLKFSMACRASAYECGDCGTTAAKTEDFCEHLLQGSYSERVLVEPKFYANSIITPNKKPADRNAVAKELAETNDELRWALRNAMYEVYDNFWKNIREILNAGKNVIANAKKQFDAARDAYVKLFDQLAAVATAANGEEVARTRVLEVTIDKARNRADFESLPWLLYGVLRDIESAGMEKGRELILRAFNDARDLFVALWKALAPEQKEMFRNQTVVVSEIDDHQTTEGVLEMQLTEQQIAALKEKLEKAEARVKELESAEAQKELRAAKKEVEDLTALLATADQETAELKTQLETAQKEAAEAKEAKEKAEAELAKAQEFVKAEREKEVARINAERSEKINAMSLADEKKEFWIAKFAVALSEAGEVEDPNGEMYGEFIQAAPAAPAEDPQDPVAVTQKNNGLHSGSHREAAPSVISSWA